MISRQKVVGWLLIIVSTACHLVFSARAAVRRRVPLWRRSEWVHFIGSIVILMIGTINVRMAAMREVATTKGAARVMVEQSEPQVS